jgi:NADH:ubiquinone oxidoreductase subunit E
MTETAQSPSIDEKVLDAVIGRFAAEQSSVLHVLQEMQKEVGYIPEQGIKKIAKAYKVPLAKVYAVATFYKQLYLKPRGRHIVKVCMGTACHVRGAPHLLDELVHSLAVKPGETTSDGNFTLETVNCVGACALGPLVLLDGEYHGNVTTAGLDKITKGVRT